MTLTSTLRLSLAALLIAGSALAQDGLDPSVEGRNATLKRALTPLNDTVAGSVVEIRLGQTLKGYGVIVREGIVTSAQVVTDGTYSLRNRDGNDFSARVRARSAKHDLALLELVPGVGAPLALGASDALEIGTYVLSPGPSGPLAVGVLSAKNRRVQRSLMQKNILLGLFQDGNEGHTRSYDRVLQHDGMLEKVHLGGPLVDRSGKLIGINVALPFRGSAHAIPVEELRAQLGVWSRDAVIEEGPAAEGPVEQMQPMVEEPEAQGPPPGGIWLGINADDAPLAQVPPTHKHGIAVLGVDPESPAAAGGLQAGDVILELDGKRLESLDHLGRLLRERTAGETVTFKLMREQRMTTVEVTLQTR
ncbi:MAG: PDZ domain-containing protein [Planctomycetota bacterium]